VETVSLADKFAQFQDYWNARVMVELNDCYAKAVKLKGEFIIVPRGVEHMPVAGDEVHIILWEPKTTLNTGTSQTKGLFARSNTFKSTGTKRTRHTE
jgi:hypothetical protein